MLFKLNSYDNSDINLVCKKQLVSCHTQFIQKLQRFLLPCFVVLFFLSCASHSKVRPPWEDSQLDLQSQEYLSSIELIDSKGDVHWFKDPVGNPNWIRVDVNSQHPIVAADQFFVKVTDGLEPTIVVDFLNNNHWEWNPQGSRGLGVVKFSENELKDYTLIEKKLNQSGLFEVVEVNPLGFGSEIKQLPSNEPRAAVTPNDASYSELWGMERIDAPMIWTVASGCDEVVWVFDTGTDLDHEDIQDNLWTNLKELNGSSGVDDDSNGYIDDIHGYDFVNNDGDPSDDHGHGSHIAGTIGAVGDNDIGVTGVCWNAKIATVKVIDSQNRYLYSNLIAGIEYLISNKEASQIVNMSLGGTTSTILLESAFAELHENKILVAVAAMNDGEDLNGDLNYYPVEYDHDNIIGVANINSNGDLATNSNFGELSVDLSAPGSSIYSLNHQGTYTWMSGTSMATPHVAGVVALIKWNQPDLDYKEIRSRILGSTLKNSQLESKVSTSGELNAFCAYNGIIPCTENILTPLEDSKLLGIEVQQFGSKLRIYSPFQAQLEFLTIDGQILNEVELQRFENWIDLSKTDSPMIIKIKTHQGESSIYQLNYLH